MANFTCAAGKNASVLIGTVAYAFKSFGIHIETKLTEVSNFTSAGYRVYCPGLNGMTVDLDGPYDVGPSGSGGNMSLVNGNSYSFTFGINSNVSYTATAIVNKSDISTEVDGAAMLKVNATVSGSFSLTII